MEGMDVSLSFRNAIFGLISSEWNSSRGPEGKWNKNLTDLHMKNAILHKGLPSPSNSSLPAAWCESPKEQGTKRHYQVNFFQMFCILIMNVVAYTHVS